MTTNDLICENGSRHLFPGSNTCTGFVGFFEDLRKIAVRTVILKGGPGVGKSTLMREAGRRYEEKGCKVIYYHCSGDPDSLDAVFIPETGFLVLDGTAPHIVDPRLPGAADAIINLGVCLKEEQLTAQRDGIESVNREISRCYARAYRYLSAAERFRADAAAVYDAALTDPKRRELEDALFSFLPEEPEGDCFHCYAQAITWKGVVSEMDSVLTEKAVCLDLPWGFDIHRLLRPLFLEAQRKRLKTVFYADPLDAGKIGHLAVGNCLFTSAVMMDAPVFAPALEKDVLVREGSKLSFDKAVYDLALNQAVESLFEAKQNHDALERYYIDAMDYARLKAVRQEFLEEMPGISAP